MPKLAELVAVLDRWYDPAWAQPWDAVGTVCGDPDQPVDAVLLAIDPVPAIVEEALDGGAQLLVVHHPLLLRGVHAVAATTPKGAMVHRMVRAGLALHVAHTNADVAAPGVSDALAERLGLGELRPLQPDPGDALDKVVVYVPVPDAEPLVDALADAGAGQLGEYDRCAWSVDGLGTFRPGPDAHPSIGTAGQVEVVPETRVEMVVPPSRRRAVVAALRAVHPYEEPAFDLLPMAPLPTGRGLGRVGALPRPMPLRRFVEHVAAVLPATAHGVRAAGDPDRPVSTVAVLGGAGDTAIEDARRAGADALLTADLRHHPVNEAVTERGAQAMALVDAAHWATEAPWLDALAVRLRAELPELRTTVSRRVTDPWTLSVGPGAPSSAEEDPVA